MFERGEERLSSLWVKPGGLIFGDLSVKIGGRFLKPEYFSPRQTLGSLPGVSHFTRVYNHKCNRTRLSLAYILPVCRSGFRSEYSIPLESFESFRFIWFSRSHCFLTVERVPGETPSSAASWFCLRTRFEW